MSWMTQDMSKMRTEMMVGEVGKTLISTHRLDEMGWDTYLTKNNPKLMNRETGEEIKLEKKGRLHYLSMWVRINKSLGEVSRLGESNEGVVHNDKQVRVFRRPATIHP